MLNLQEFLLLTTLYSGTPPKKLDLRLSERLESKGLLHQGQLTDQATNELKNYRVDNAVILAAGLSSRFAPISYERPKGLLKVRGEILIERQIKQLQAAGINEIFVVVGYKQESFYYLEEKFGVHLVINNEYATRNNNASLMLVREHLSNTYICSSDNYFEKNPFEKYVWRSYYAAEYSKGPTKEWCLKEDSDGRITGVNIGGSDSWFMIGHAYFDRQFSNTFGIILETEYDLPQTRDKLWEDIFIEHIHELEMFVRKYDPPTIWEFDSLDELRQFDPLFLENLDSEIFDNISSVLGCQRSEIHDIYPLKQGLTNLSCHFATDNGEWVYRHPGIGSELLIDRKAEYTALQAARALKLDSTFVFADSKRGWKISRFIPNSKNLDAHDDAQLKLAMQMARRLHECTTQVKRSFSFYEESKKYESSLLSCYGIIDIPDWDEMERQATELNACLLSDGEKLVLCHNDFFGLNFLLAPNGHIDLIDWEYAGMSDYANDFGTFSVCEQLSEHEMHCALAHYFGRKPTLQEWRHNLGQVGMAGWCWYAWSLVKEKKGDCVGDWLHIYYRYAKRYLKEALSLYNKESPNSGFCTNPIPSEKGES